MSHQKSANRLPAFITEFSTQAFWDVTLDCLDTPRNPAEQFSIFDLDSRALEVSGKRIVEEGFVQLPVLPWDPWFADITKAVKKLEQLRIPLAFIFTRYQPWLLAVKLHRIIEQLFGEPCLMLPDFWVWHVDPQNQDQGWKPHRDKGPGALFPDGRPKSLTVWLPLTDATTQNGCMYVIPANRDSSYAAGTFDPSRLDLQNIVALPAQAGSVLIWNQAVMHWGARTLNRATAPRISIAFEFQMASVPAFNQPLLNPGVIPDFDTRVNLICKQMLQYKHMYALDPDMEINARSFMAAHNEPVSPD